MQKKLQVFVSSTYLDLMEERQAVVQAILGAKHIPAGMELFCAGDKSQLMTIKQWIDRSDVFMLILGGRYGCIDPESGKSYVQIEYEYALRKGRPLFAAVISQDHLDQLVKVRGKEVLELEHPDLYRDFRALVTSRMCRFFSDTKDLKLIVHESLREIDQGDDLVGWIRADDGLALLSERALSRIAAPSRKPISIQPSEPNHTPTLSKKPTIGLNLDYQSSRGLRPAFMYLNAGYPDGIAKAGGVPLLMPPLHDDSDINALVAMVDGIVFVGGADLDPSVDGFMRHPSTRLLDRRREEFDRRLMQCAIQRAVPVLGIGAGMQLLNVSLGGNLFLHLPDDMPRGLPHCDPSDPYCRHGLVVEPESIMERIYGEAEVQVNSMHHMAIDDLGAGLVVTARAPDGVVEAVESNSTHWLAIGTQFHPEGQSASVLDQRVFDEFVSGCVDRMRR